MLFPYERTPQFQILANLKRNAFVDSELDSAPELTGNAFDSMAEFLT